MSLVKQLKLYSYYQSSASWRVRAVLAFKGIPFEYEPINLLTGAQHSDIMPDINPMRQVPAMSITTNKDESHLINQSMTIIQFLEDNFPESPSIFPEDPILKYKSRAIAETITSGIQPLQNLETLVEYKKPLGLGETSREERFKIAQFWMTRKFEHLEKLVKASAGKFCVGDKPSLADFCLVPQMYNAKRFEIDMTPYATLVSINERLLEMDFIIKSHPLACPDAPATN